MTILSEFDAIDEEELLSVIKHIKTKSGIDFVNIDVVNDAMQTLKPFLLNTINSSLNKGYCPKQWRKSMVTPIKKIQNAYDASDLRPINQISIPDKITEHFVKKQIESHVQVNEILTPRQSAFRAKYSCETAVNLVVAEWKENLDEGMVVIAVFLDFRRAFETVNHEILLRILSDYGITGKVNDWIKSWLTNRTQRTKYNCSVSEEIPIDIGDPQGTPLSCLLFALYINRLPNALNQCAIKMFADDTLIWIAVKRSDILNAVQILNTELLIVEQFLQMLRLKLNYAKTQFMVIGNNVESIDVQIHFGDMQINRTDIIKYLGVMIDHALNFHANHEYVLKKIAKKTNYLGRQRKKFDLTTKKLLYTSTIAPHLDYCATVLYYSTNEQIVELQRLQNRCMRHILNLDRYAHVDDMLKTLNMMDVRQRINFNVILTIHKAATGCLPDYLCNQLKTVNELQPYNLRTNQMYRVPQYKKDSTQKSIFHNGVKMYNDFKKIKSTNVSINVMKSQLEEYVKSKFSSH